MELAMRTARSGSVAATTVATPLSVFENSSVMELAACVRRQRGAGSDIVSGGPKPF
jgi:hypothetical protein